MFAILLGISLKSVAVLAAAWLMTLLLRGRSAAARHLVWTAAASAIVALPLLSLALPSWRVVTPESIGSANVGLVFRVISIAGAETAATPTATEISAGTVGSPTHMPWHTGWRTWATALWVLGAAAVLLQMLLAYLRIGRLRAGAQAWPEDFGFVSLARSLGIAEQVALLEGPAGTMPMAGGVLHPAVFLPADARQWSEERRRVVLLHELAHVRRGDVAAHWMARAALSLNWWNPLAWLAWREFLKECERAADDLVLASGARPSDYAGHLLEVARSMQSPAGTASAALAMARRAELEGRLLAILDSRVRRHTVGRGALVAAALGSILLIAPFAAVQAQDQSAAAVPPELSATVSAAKSQKNPAMLDQAAEAYERLQKYDVAETLLEDALAIRGEVSGATSASYATGLVKLGDLASNRYQREKADSFYQQAVALGDRPEVAVALVRLGISNLPRNRDLARDYFQRAANVDPDGPKAGPAYTWLAQVRQNDKDGAVEAESLYQKALSVEKPDSPAAANTMHLYARFLQQQGRTDESAAMEKQARDLSQKAATDFARSLQASSTTDLRFRSDTVTLPNGEVTTAINGGGGRGEDGNAQAGISGGAFRVGGSVTAPALLSKVEPGYTEEARAAKYQGTVLAYIEVGPDGRAHNIRVIRGLGLGLDEKAIEALSKWTFKPGTKDGQPVPVQATVEVNFRLQ
jgi:TonB family protein